MTTSWCRWVEWSGERCREEACWSCAWRLQGLAAAVAGSCRPLLLLRLNGWGERLLSCHGMGEVQAFVGLLEVWCCCKALQSYDGSTAQQHRQPQRHSSALASHHPLLSSVLTP